MVTGVDPTERVVEVSRCRGRASRLSVCVPLVGGQSARTSRTRAQRDREIQLSVDEQA